MATGTFNISPPRLATVKSGWHWHFANMHFSMHTVSLLEAPQGAWLANPSRIAITRGNGTQITGIFVLVFDTDSLGDITFEYEPIGLYLFQCNQYYTDEKSSGQTIETP